MGKRPLTALRASDLARLRMKLVRFGAPPSVSCMLSDAIEADLVITDAVTAGERVVGPQRHPLAASVHRRDLNNLITWPFTGIPPPQFAPLAGRQTFRRGPVADRPVLTAAERTRLFDHLLVTADAHRDECDALLRRQAIYLLGFDTRSDSVNWLATEQRNAVRSAGRSDEALRASAQVKVEQTESDPELTPQARRELASVAYAIRLADR